MLDMERQSPGLIKQLVLIGAKSAVDRLALAKESRDTGAWVGPIFWDGIRKRLSGTSAHWHAHRRAALRSLLGRSHWPQERLFRHGLAYEPWCQRCGAAAGTLWHRHHQCDATAEWRRQYAPKWLAEHAARASRAGHEVGERFCRPSFPDPGHLFPRVEPAEEDLISWVNRPADGLLKGLCFSDGSAILPEYACLRRAGWAVVSVDRNGNLLSAAYGPVPLHEAPQQTAKQAEDYAILMLSRLAMAPIKVGIDCASTCDQVQLGPGHSRAMHPGCHWWDQVWAQFEAGDLEAFKTKAHCSEADVTKGKTTAWERRGNRHADVYAKKGAFKHAVDLGDLDLVYGLALVAHEVATYAGMLEAHLAKEEVKDTEGLPMAAQEQHLEVLEEPGRRAIWREASASKALAELQAAAGPRSIMLKGHSLMVAEVLADDAFPAADRVGEQGAVGEECPHGPLTIYLL